jgi:hypothetical protein
MMRNGEEAEEGEGEEIEEGGKARSAGPEEEGHEDEKREDEERKEEDGAKIPPESCAGPGPGQQPGSRSDGRRHGGWQRGPITASQNGRLPETAAARNISKTFR